MRVKVDEDLPRRLTEFLRNSGYDAESVSDEEMGGWSDRDVWEACQSEKRFLVTADKGVADLRLHPPGTHVGVLLLRPDEEGIAPSMALLESVLDAGGLGRLRGAIAVVTPRGLRIRKADTS